MIVICNFVLVFTKKETLHSTLIKSDPRTVTMSMLQSEDIRTQLTIRKVFYCSRYLCSNLSKISRFCKVILDNTKGRIFKSSCYGLLKNLESMILHAIGAPNVCCSPTKCECNIFSEYLCKIPQWCKWEEVTWIQWSHELKYAAKWYTYY